MVLKYNWQKSDWPAFRYDLSVINEALCAVSEKTGLISGKLTHLSEELRTETLISFLVEEAVKTSKIEGEYINRIDIRSSIKNKLGLNKIIIPVHDRRAKGIAELMIDVRNTFKEPLSEYKLYAWHEMLFGGFLNPALQIGCWRTGDEPMEIISGYYGKKTMHYEAPPSEDVPKEMKRFIHWFNNTSPDKPEAIKFAPVRAAIAHLYFESIHPFEDGNGRIGRAIAEKALSQGFGYPAMLSLSRTIEANKKAYYSTLHSASQSNEITAWIQYFVDTILSAQISVEEQINFILKKSIFFDRYQNDLNERQIKVLRRMMHAGIKGFEGGMSAKKYMSITGISKATATRDLQHLLLINAFKQIGSGRSVRYELNFSDL
ncbi:MAG TPA: Fic family protein [Gammaproteobacteria bacterium]|jgi:Fic family protein|nr:Fic family protein [Gammaproteobacteria bacterium]